MTEQEKREKVIKGLECRLECWCMQEDHCNQDCPYLGDSRACRGLDEDALALLQAQEPRVMSLEEIPDAVFGWMEIFGQLVPCVLEDVYVDDTVGFANIEDGHDYICVSGYGKTWRCWTSRPTDAQREATPWNG